MKLRDRVRGAVQGFRGSIRGREPALTEREATQEAVRREVRALGEECAEMLQDQRYGSMRKLYQRIVEGNMRLMIWYDVPQGTVDRDALYCEAMRRYQQQLRTLSQIVDAPKEFVARAEAAAKAPVERPRATGYAPGAPNMAARRA